MREKWQDRFEYIQVDEFQDVSKTEFDLVHILASKHKNLFIVGDPDQTIYSWRGAQVDYILDFVRRNKGFGILIWFRTLHFSKKDALAIDKFISEHQELVHGLKFHPTLSQTKCTSKKLEPFLKIARKYNLPILVHTALDEYANINELATLAKNNHDINFIAAHLELGSNNKYALSKLKEVSNLYGDTAWVNMESLREAKKLNIINKIMFGSDSPIDGKDTLNHKFYKGYFSNKIGLRKDDYDKLMYKNALKIYSIDEKDLITRYQWDKSPR